MIEPQCLFFLPTKPIEELYDTQNGPQEANNLADDPHYGEVSERTRQALRQWLRETSDVGLIPEPELDEMQRPAG